MPANPKEYAKKVTNIGKGFYVRYYNKGSKSKAVGANYVQGEKKVDHQMEILLCVSEHNLQYCKTTLSVFFFLFLFLRHSNLCYHTRVISVILLCFSRVICHNFQNSTAQIEGRQIKLTVFGRNVLCLTCLYFRRNVLETLVRKDNLTYRWYLRRHSPFQDRRTTSFRLQCHSLIVC